MIIVVGRGNSGTRAVARTLRESGVFVGDAINVSFDLIPYEPMYKAAKLFGPNVEYVEEDTLEFRPKWDFSKALKAEVPEQFKMHIDKFLKQIYKHDGLKGYKIPETSLIYPWIIQLFPEAFYIYIVRDPRDVIGGYHTTDDLKRWNVPCSNFIPVRWADMTANSVTVQYAKDKARLLMQRAESWKYQRDLYKATKPPKFLHEIRFEDLILDQDRTVKELEDFLGIKLTKIVVDATRAYSWRRQKEFRNFSFLSDYLKELGYEGE